MARQTALGADCFTHLASLLGYKDLTRLSSGFVLLCPSIYIYKNLPEDEAMDGYLFYDYLASIEHNHKARAEVSSLERVNCSVRVLPLFYVCSW